MYNMDIGAYANIEKIESIAAQNGIVVPRLRGYRLMKDENPINIKEFIDSAKNDIAISCASDLCESDPFWDPDPKSWSLSGWTDYLKGFYLVSKQDENGYNKYIDIRWNRIHGWKRKVLKTYIHNEIRKQVKQWEAWNKYAGRDDVLYIHARIGGPNWIRYFKEVQYQPWFLEKVDDGFDSTYCDIYAKISITNDKENVV